MISPDTVKMLSEARSGSLANLAQKLGLPASMRGTLADILNNRADHVTTETENRVRATLGLPPKPRLVTVTACPSCGIVHGEGLDCHGQPVAAVVVLAPGQTVRRARKPPEKWVDYATAALCQALVNRQPLAATPRYYDRAGRCYTDWQEMGR